MRTGDGSPKARDAAYRSEHMLAWVLALGALIMAIIGALVSFDIFDLRDATGPAAAVANFEDSLLLFIPAFMLAILAWTMHDTEHHVRPSVATDDPAVGRGEKAMYSTEHGLAYFAALAAIVLGVIGLIVGFDVLDEGNSWRDGATWQLLGLVTAGLSATLHASGHHQMAAEREEIDVLIEDRIGSALERAGGVRPVGGTERIVDRR